MNDREASNRSSRTRDLTRLVPAAIITVAFLAFVVDNSQRVSVGFVVTERRVPLIFVLLISAALGALVGLLAGWHRRR